MPEKSSKSRPPKLSDCDLSVWMTGASRPNCAEPNSQRANVTLAFAPSDRAERRVVVDFAEPQRLVGILAAHHEQAVHEAFAKAKAEPRADVQFDDEQIEIDRLEVRTELFLELQRRERLGDFDAQIVGIRLEAEEPHVHGRRRHARSGSCPGMLRSRYS